MITDITLKNNFDVPSLSSDSLQVYLNSIADIPVLSAIEEQKLAEKFYRDGDLEAAQSLIVANLKFVVHIAKSYKGYGINLSDLIQEGNVGLMKAVKRFDPTLGVRLISFAVHWIKAEIHEYILKNWKLVKIATTKAQRKLFFNLRKSKKNLGWLSKEETKRLALDLGVKESDVMEMEKRMSSNDVSFDPLEDSDDEFTPSSFVTDEAINPSLIIENEDYESTSQARLLESLDLLDQRSKDIVQKRWLNENKATLHELADAYQVSAERIRQIENQALLKLRESIISKSSF
ncbi:MAG: RNA polymerase sigma factor RpoH [Proteobacteria bacterium]|nr:RNA polymerase sigma factor RpoH [Pseudomonadota bacterium]